MKKYILKSLLGKYICKHKLMKYCHIDRIIAVKDNKAIVTSVVESHNNQTYHWFLEVSWSTDKYGIHQIENYKILKEDELNEFSKKDESL